jgi:adenosine deaminase
MPPTTTNTRDEASSRIIIEAMPKVELHAHLNGCIRPSTLQDLAKERNVCLSSLHHHHHDPDGETAGAGSTKSMMYNSRPRSLKDCFDIFAEIPKCVDNKASLHRITQEALQDFADCHVVYLELRSTPKNMKDLTKREYCELILETMLNFEEKQQSDDDDESSHTMRRLPMTCRFIIAADRSSTITEAMDHVDLAIALREKYPDHVVGVDLGGNPCKVCRCKRQRSICNNMD